MQGHLSRVGMTPGDTVFASGPLGSGATVAAFALLGLAEQEQVEADWQPQQRITEGKALRGIASACMDTSDGLVAILDQLVRLNEVAIRIDVPLDSLLDARSAALQRALQLSALPFLAAPHGEFELVFSVPESRLGALESVARAIDWQPLRLGRVEAGAGLFMGSAPIDGARLRNLAGAARVDLGAYINVLSAL
jgi:thiamine-monophosphate kinase